MKIGGIFIVLLVIPGMAPAGGEPEITLNLDSSRAEEPSSLISISKEPGYRQEAGQVQQLEDGLIVVGLQESPEDLKGNLVSQGKVLVFHQEKPDARLIETIPLGEHFEHFEPILLREGTDSPHRLALAIYGFSGNHYYQLWVYEISKEGTPQKLFANGSAAGIGLVSDPETDRTLIKIGVEAWEKGNWNYATGPRLWQVYAWDGNAFVYQPPLSSAPPWTEEDRSARNMEAFQALTDASEDIAEGKPPRIKAE